MLARRIECNRVLDSPTGRDMEIVALNFVNNFDLVKI